METTFLKKAWLVGGPTNRQVTLSFIESGSCSMACSSSNCPFRGWILPTHSKISPFAIGLYTFATFSVGNTSLAGAPGCVIIFSSSCGHSASNAIWLCLESRWILSACFKIWMNFLRSRKLLENLGISDPCKVMRSLLGLGTLDPNLIHARKAPGSAKWSVWVLRSRFFK